DDIPDLVHQILRDGRNRLGSVFAVDVELHLGLDDDLIADHAGQFGTTVLLGIRAGRAFFERASVRRSFDAVSVRIFRAAVPLGIGVLRTLLVWASIDGVGDSIVIAIRRAAIPLFVVTDDALLVGASVGVVVDAIIVGVVGAAVFGRVGV